MIRSAGSRENDAGSSAARAATPGSSGIVRKPAARPSSHARKAMELSEASSRDRDRLGDHVPVRHDLVVDQAGEGRPSVVAGVGAVEEVSNALVCRRLIHDAGILGECHADSGLRDCRHRSDREAECLSAYGRDISIERRVSNIDLPGLDLGDDGLANAHLASHGRLAETVLLADCDQAIDELQAPGLGRKDPREVWVSRGSPGDREIEVIHWVPLYLRREQYRSSPIPSRDSTIDLVSASHLGATSQVRGCYPVLIWSSSRSQPVREGRGPSDLPP